MTDPGRIKQDDSLFSGEHRPVDKRGKVERVLYWIADRFERAAWKRTEIRRGNLSGGGW